MTIHEIRTEEDIHHVMNMIEHHDWRSEDSVLFIDWKYQIILRGESFDGGVPTRIMPSLITLQTKIRAIYAEHIHKDPAHKFDKKEIDSTEIIVRIKDGHSSLFDVPWDRLLNGLVQNMSGTESLVAILGVASIISSSLLIVRYWSLKHDNRKLEHEKAMTEDQRRHCERVLELSQNNPTVMQALEGMTEVNKRIASGMHDDDILLTGNEQMIATGEEFKRFTKKPRAVIEPVQDHISGMYRIASVDTMAIPDGFKLKVISQDTGETLMVNIPAETLPEEQEKILQSGEWGKKPVQMELNVVLKKDSIISATLTRAGLSTGD